MSGFSMGSSDNCSCGMERVEIESAVLDKLVKIVRPNMGTVRKSSNKGWMSVCPRCDSYGLGIELIEKFPLRTQDGEITDIQTLANSPDFWEK